MAFKFKIVILFPLPPSAELFLIASREITSTKSSPPGAELLPDLIISRLHLEHVLLLLSKKNCCCHNPLLFVLLIKEESSSLKSFCLISVSISEDFKLVWKDEEEKTSNSQSDVFCLDSSKQIVILLHFCEFKCCLKCPVLSL